MIFSTDAEAARGFLLDALALDHINAHDGWLIFTLPPLEIAVPPDDENGHHELFFMTEDIEAFRAVMLERGVNCGEVSDQGWGLLTRLRLPGRRVEGIPVPTPS